MKFSVPIVCVWLDFTFWKVINIQFEEEIRGKQFSLVIFIDIFSLKLFKAFAL